MTWLANTRCMSAVIVCNNKGERWLVCSELLQTITTLYIPVRESHTRACQPGGQIVEARHSSFHASALHSLVSEMLTDMFMLLPYVSKNYLRFIKTIPRHYYFTHNKKLLVNLLMVRYHMFSKILFILTIKINQI